MAYIETINGLDLSTGAFVTPEMFGAVGDGVADDTAALQDAIDYGFSNGSAVVLSASYGIKSPIEVVGVSSTAGGKGSEIHGINGAKITALAAVDSIIKTRAEADSRAYGIILDNVILQGNSRATDGFTSSNAISESNIENVTITECTNGIHITANCYLNSFKSVRPYHCTGYGILFENGNNTSNVFEKCYVDTCPNAYKLNGQYSSMVSCCADNVTGTVFDLASFTGALVGCGSEANAFETMFKLGANTNVIIAGGMYFGNTAQSGYYFDLASGARAGIYNATINYSSAASSGALCKLDYLARLTIKDTVIYRAFNGTNSLHASSYLYENTAFHKMTVAVTLDANNEATIDLAPSRYTITNVFSTDRSGWEFIPMTVSNSTYKVRVTSANNYFPTISDKNFTLAITYVDREVM